MVYKDTMEKNWSPVIGKGKRKAADPAASPSKHKTKIGGDGSEVGSEDVEMSW